MMTMNALTGGGKKGTKWHETWDSMSLRVKQMGVRPLWQMFFKIYNYTESESYDEKDAQLAADHLQHLIRCDRKSYAQCNAKKRRVGELQTLMGTAGSCTRTAREFNQFLASYIGSFSALYGTGGAIGADGMPLYPGTLGYNIAGAMWIGLIKSYLFIPNGLTFATRSSELGWSYVGRWVNCVTHFSKAFAGPKHKHHYVRAVDMIQPRAFAGISDKTVTNQWADAETSVISSIASSSNAPVQSLLDIIWMMESDMCKSVPAEVKAPDEKTMQKVSIKMSDPPMNSPFT
jgi:hypothetical protein